MRRRLLAAAAVAVAVVAIPAIAGVPPATADIYHPTVVSADPVDFTPHVLDGTVWSLALVGDTVVVGGAFTKVSDASRRMTFARKNIFAFGLHDGQIRTFAPEVDGAVYSLATGPDYSVYLGGGFKSVNGTAQRGLARVSMHDGSRYSSFGARVNWGDVRALVNRDGTLYAGGTFSAVNGVRRSGLVRLNGLTGAVDQGFDARLAGPGLKRTRVEHFDVSVDGRKLIAVGAFLKSGTADRNQIALFDVGGPNAILNGWYTDAFIPTCMQGFDTYLRQVKFAPDGSYIVVAATGRASSAQKLCDSASRFETRSTGKQNPTWVQRTGGDSLYAVAITGPAIYLGGHQRWFDNPYGTDGNGPGPGAVSRPGIGAVNPNTGKALEWNPTRSRGVGVRAFLVTPDYLLVGSDTDQLGREYHGRVGMFPVPRN